MVSIPYLKGVSEEFKRIARKHRFRTTFKPGTKVKQIKSKCQRPLGDKRKAVVYRIPCQCDKAIYVGETRRLFQTRKKEHTGKVTLTDEDVQKKETYDKVEERMRKEYGGLARHNISCVNCVNKNERFIDKTTTIYTYIIFA